MSLTRILSAPKSDQSLVSSTSCPSTDLLNCDRQKPYTTAISSNEISFHSSILAGPRTATVLSKQPTMFRQHIRETTTPLDCTNVNLDQSRVDGPFDMPRPELINPWRAKPLVSKEADKLGSGHDNAVPKQSQALRHDSITEDAELHAELDRDERIYKQMYDLRASVEDFAKLFPAKHNEHVFDQLMDSQHIETLRYVGCLALAGSQAEQSWRQLLADGDCRHALVVGMVGRAMQEFVFSSLYFGASDEVTNALEEQEVNSVERDGFFHQRERAALIATATHSPEALRKALLRLTLQLEMLLLPLFNAKLVVGISPSALRAPLATLLETAATLSRTMRSHPDTIYHFPPTFKDEELDPARMEPRNLAALHETSPWQRPAPGHERPTLAPGTEHRQQALVRIVGFPGLVSYRQGGGGVARLALVNEARGASTLPGDVRAARKGQERGECEGFRTRVLCKASVQIQWGRQALLTQEAGTGRHLEAMANGDLGRYEEDKCDRKELFAIYAKRLMENGKGQGKARGTEGVKLRLKCTAL
nr:hypothetical protein CFP56_24559 [Quercus suber]